MSEQKLKRVAIYARVSTNEQNCENQLRELRKFVSAHDDWRIHEVFVDTGVSGAKDAHERAALSRLMDQAAKRQFEIVLVFALDRFARNTLMLLQSMTAFKDAGIRFVSYHENLDSSTAIGTAMYTILGVLAELERRLIVERVRCGIQRAKAEGKVMGRPRVEVNDKQVRSMRSQGLSLREIGRRLGVSRMTIRDRLNSL